MFAWHQKKIQFLLLSLLVAMAKCQNSEQVEHFTDFADVTLKIDVHLQLNPAKMHLSDFLKAVYDHFPIGEENEEKTVVCLQIDDSKDGKRWQIRRVLSKKDEFRFYIAQVIDSNRQQLNRKSEDNCAKARPGAHQALIAIEKPDRFRGLRTDDWLSAVTASWQHLVQSSSAIVHILLNSFDSRQPADSQIGAVWYNSATNTTTQRQGPSLRDLSDELVKELWNQLRQVFGGCEYTIRPSSCFYVYNASTCYREKIISQYGDVKPKLASICGKGGHYRRLCDKSQCDLECRKRLDETPCQPECGPGTKNLSTTDDETKHCPDKWINCTRGPCPSNSYPVTPNPDAVRDAADRAWKRKLGEALMIGGFLFFAIGAVGLLLFFWFVFFRVQEPTPAIDQGVVKKTGPSIDRGVVKKTGKGKGRKKK